MPDPDYYTPPVDQHLGPLRGVYRGRQIYNDPAVGGFRYVPDPPRPWTPPPGSGIRPAPRAGASGGLMAGGGPGVASSSAPVRYDPNAALPGYRDPGYGPREDGTRKGFGYFGPLLGPGGDHVSELSASASVDGRDLLFPLLVPTLNFDQLMNLMNGGGADHATFSKALNHARGRMGQGRSVWAEPGEVYPLPSPFAPPPAPGPVQFLMDFGRFVAGMPSRPDPYAEAYRRYDPYGSMTSSPSVPPSLQPRPGGG